MATFEEKETGIYTEVKNRKTELMLGELREVFRNFTNDSLRPVDADEGEEDRVFAGLLASNLIAYSMRPRAIRSETEIAALIEPYPGTGFQTDLQLGEIAKMIAESGAMYRGHFELLSRLHSDLFFMFSRLGGRVEFRNRLSLELAKRFEARKIKIETVIAPVSAGGLLAQDIASVLKCDYSFFEIDQQSRPCSRLKEGYTVHGPTLIVNDMTTTGDGLMRMVKEVQRHTSAALVGVGLLATRGGLGEQKLAEIVRSGLAVEVLARLKMESHKKEDCTQCQSGIPATLSADINR